MPNKLTALRFDQAANLVDDPANPKAVITLFKRRAEQPETPDWRAQDAEHFAKVQKFIRQEGGRWCVFSEAGKTLGCHDTKADAVRQLAAIEANKRLVAADATYFSRRRNA